MSQHTCGCQERVFPPLVKAVQKEPLIKRLLDVLWRLYGGLQVHRAVFRENIGQSLHRVDDSNLFDGLFDQAKFYTLEDRPSFQFEANISYFVCDESLGVLATAWLSAHRVLTMPQLKRAPSQLAKLLFNPCLLFSATAALRHRKLSS